MSVVFRVPVLRRAVIEAQSALVARLHTGCFGPGLRAYGFPIVTVAPGSVLRCGSDLHLVSDPIFSEPGVSHPCVLRTLASGASLLVGDDVGMSGSTICAAQSVTIGDQVLMGANVVVTDSDFHPLAPERRRWSREGVATAPVAIDDNVFLGMNSLVLKGVTIGRDAVVAAGSVVTRDVPAGAIVAGAPATVVGAVPGYDVPSGATP